MRKAMQRRVVAAALVLGLLPAGGAAADLPVHRPVVVWSDGVPLSATLWLPGALGDGEKVPGMLLVHGWGGVRSHLDQAYAPQFASLGIAVLTFDYASWGDSPGPIVRVPEPVPEGQPLESRGDGYLEARHLVDPLLFLENIRDALAFLLGEPAVDVSRLAIWGTSLGGGLALQTAIDYPEIGVLTAQIANVNPIGGIANLPDTSPLSRTGAIRARSARARGETGPFPGAESALPGLRGNMNWSKTWHYDPFDAADRLTAATLIIDAAEEELFDIRVMGEALFHRIRHRTPAAYHTLPGQHYDLYRGPSYQQALNLQMDWLREHLLAEAAP